MVAATLIVALTLDFCAYWIHRLHHETTWLWPFHALHHSAEVLTPITLHRRHPVYDLLSIALRSVVIGVVLGVTLFAFLGSLDVYTIGGANVVYVVFRTIGANFNHTHIWFSYGRVLEHILVSPAQHQIHHSRAIEHHDKNYGEIFAFWDWMFGTLYVPERREALEFGLADADGRPIEQPYTTLRDAMLRPFAQSWEALRESLGRASRAGTRRRPATRPGAAEPQSGEQLIRYPSRVPAE